VLGVAIGGEILDDDTDETQRAGYVSVQDTIDLFRSLGLEVRDA
jgi:hypothetical protein